MDTTLTNNMNASVLTRGIYKNVSRSRLSDQRIAQFTIDPTRHLFSPRYDCVPKTRATFVQSLPGVKSTLNCRTSYYVKVKFCANHPSNAICSLQRSLYSTPIDIQRGLGNFSNLAESLDTHLSVPISIARVFNGERFEWPDKFLHSNYTMHEHSATMLFREPESHITIYPTTPDFDPILSELYRTHIPLQYDPKNTMQPESKNTMQPESKNTMQLATIQSNKHEDVFELATRVMEVYIHRQNSAVFDSKGCVTPQLLLLVTDSNMAACSLFCQWMTWLFFIYFAPSTWQINKLCSQVQLAQTTFAFEKAVLLLNCQHRLLFPSQMIADPHHNYNRFYLQSEECIRINKSIESLLNRPFQGFKAKLLTKLYNNACHIDGNVAVILPTVRYGVLMWNDNTLQARVRNFDLHVLFVLRQQFIVPEYLDELEMYDVSPRRQFQVFLNKALNPNPNEYGLWGRKVAHLHLCVLKVWTIIIGELYSAILGTVLNADQMQLLYNGLSRMWLDWNTVDSIAKGVGLKHCKVVTRTASTVYWDFEYLHCQHQPQFFKQYFNAMQLSPSKLQPIMISEELSDSHPRASPNSGGSTFVPNPYSITLTPNGATKTTPLTPNSFHPSPMTAEQSTRYLTPMRNSEVSSGIECSTPNGGVDLQLLQCEPDQVQEPFVVAAGQTCLLSFNDTIEQDDVIHPCLITAIERQYIQVVYDLENWTVTNIPYPTFIRPFINESRVWTARINAIFVPGYISEEYSELYCQNGSFLQQPLRFTYDKVAAVAYGLQLFPDDDTTTFIMTGMTLRISIARCTVPNLDKQSRVGLSFSNCQTFNLFYVTKIDTIKDQVKGYCYTDGDQPRLSSAEHTLSIQFIVSISIRLDIHLSWIEIKFPTWIDGECAIDNLAYGTLEVYCDPRRSSELIHKSQMKTAVISIAGYKHRLFINDNTSHLRYNAVFYSTPSNAPQHNTAAAPTSNVPSSKKLLFHNVPNNNTSTPSRFLQSPSPLSDEAAGHWADRYLKYSPARAI
jgi:hypothetical protein